MSFKHKTDTVHYHDTVAEARACEESVFALCEHGMSLDLCSGPQHYPYDEDESTFGGYYNTQAKGPLTDQEAYRLGIPVKTHFQGAVRTEDGMYRQPKHQDPCVCSVYDRCWEVRVGDAQWSGNWRDKFRAYND